MSTRTLACQPTVGCAITRLALTLTLLLVVAGCGGREPQPPRTSDEPGPRHPVLAQATSERWPGLTLEVVGLQRPAADVLEVKLVIVNAATGAAVDPLDVFAADPSERGTLSGTFLMDAGGEKKYFVLRDSAGRPQCSAGLGRIEAGGRADGFARFVAPGSDVAAVTVHVPGFAPAGPVPPGGAPR